MAFGRASGIERGRGAAAAAAITALLGLALIAGLATRDDRPADDTIALFEIASVPPPPAPREERPVPPRAPESRPEGAASPPNLRSEATQIVAPEPQVQVPVPPPVVTAPVAGSGSDASQGSAEVVGPGTGSGGFGDGRGSGGRGDGDGGGGDGAETAPRQTGGRIRDSDFPDALAEVGIGGTVGVRYVVGRNGRVGDCEVTESSGSDTLDALTCRLIRERFRFRPSRDARGRPVPSTIVQNHSWEIQREPAPPAPVERRRPRIFG